MPISNPSTPSLPDATVGDRLESSADVEADEGVGTWTKKKEVVLARNGTFRVSFEHRSANANPSEAQVWKNGVAHGTLHNCSQDTYHTHSEDLAFSKGDLCQLYLRLATTSSKGKNFRIYTEYPVVNLVTLDIA